MRHKISSTKLLLSFTDPKDTVEFEKKFFADRMIFITWTCLGMAIFAALLIVIEGTDLYYAITRTAITDRMVQEEMQGEESVLFHGTPIPKDAFFQVSFLPLKLIS